MNNQGDIDRVKGLIESGDYLQAFGLLQPLAEDGDSNAQVLIGDLFLAGHGVNQNHATALKWYQKAADQGSPQGHFWVSILSKNNQPGEFHFSMAKTLFLSRAELGDAEALYWLGLLFTLSGNEQEAIKWYQRAANIGHVGAINDLIGLYYHGIPEKGIQPNRDKAIALYAEAKKKKIVRFDLPEHEHP